MNNKGIEYLYAENIDKDKVKITILVDGEIRKFEVYKFFLLNDIREVER